MKTFIIHLTDYKTGDKYHYTIKAKDIFDAKEIAESDKFRLTKLDHPCNIEIFEVQEVERRQKNPP